MSIIKKISKRNNGLVLLSIVMSAILSMSCRQSELQPTLQSPNDGKTVSVKIELNIPSTTTVRSGSITRSSGADGGFEVVYDDQMTQVATKSDGTTKLHNLWLFQFNADGSINGAPFRVTDAVTSINDMVVLEVPLKVAENQTLYILVLGPKIEADFSAIHSLNELKGWEFAYTVSVEGESRSKINSDSEIPLAGSVSGVKVVDIQGEERGLIEHNTPNGFGGNIPIYRLMSVITLRYEFDVPGYVYDGVRLINASGWIRLTNPEKNAANDQYLTLSPNKIDSLSKTLRLATWYVPQNRQGDVAAIQTENARYYKVVNNVTSGLAPAKGCHIEVWSHSGSLPDEFAVYQIYVGLNNTSNFDVLANNAYNLRTTINTEINSAQKDERIRAFAASQSIYFCSSAVIRFFTYPPPNGTMYDIDSHYDRRPITVQTHGTTVDVGIYTDQSCTKLADPSKSWLKISSSGNYTDARNNALEPLGTLVKANTFLPTQLKFYLYNDEFLLDDNGQIPPDNTKRRLYIQARTRTIGSDGKEILRAIGVFAIDQHAAVCYGNFGGARGDMLFADDVVEMSLQYDRETVNKINSVEFGFKSFCDTTGYPASLSDGRANTRWLAEATHANANQGAENSFDNPRRLANGKIDINQYTYYNTYAARYCYDRNRDENGNGQIDDDELKWYLPALTELLGHWVTLDISRQYYSNHCQSSHVNFRSAYTTRYFMNASDGQMIALNASGSKIARCVRSLPKEKFSVASSPTVYVHTSASGAKYAAINCKTLPRNVIVRRDDNSFYKENILLFHYTVDGKNAPPVLDENGKQLTTRRVIRYNRTSPLETIYNPNRFASANFLVSPRDVSSLGRDTATVDGPMTMNWATASGYLATANTTDYTIEASATNRGCHYYLGADGKDKPGDWRIPTQREWAVIMIVEDALIGTAKDTKFNQLTFNRGYWTSAETSYNSDRAWYIYSLLTPGSFSYMTGDGGKALNYYLRCIKDLE